MQTYRPLNTLRTRFTAFIGGLVLSACAAQISTDPALINNGLRAVPSHMDGLAIRDQANFQQYSQIYFEPLHIEFSDEPRHDSPRHRHEDDQFDDDERATFEKKFIDAFSSQWMERLSWEPVNAPGPGVLTLRAAITDLYLYASIKNDRPMRETAFTGESSKMELNIEILDPAGTVLLRAKDHRTTGQTYGSGPGQLQRFSAVSYWSDVYQDFRQSAASLASGIEEQL